MTHYLLKGKVKRKINFRNEIDVAMLGFMQSRARIEDFQPLHSVGKDAEYIISKTVHQKVIL